ncbi:AraC family transcriptional regulator [Ulvibacterium sp.]|uniref:helix-turn-helix domain-containing protein n=1 Tax=Ulvibacterium sp. TaxID=2665914 RepID=UPI00260E7952|nr:helix-turn-helix domain-containing protein [Ulvibacterium sp.]
MNKIITISSISQAHQLLGLQPPKHPLVSLINIKDLPLDTDFGDVRFMLELYMVSLKDGVSGSMGYGRNSYDFTNGTMIFSKPDQVLFTESKEIEDDAKGWMLLFHPDLIRRSELGKQMDSYSYFSYNVHEALHLSEDEKSTLTDLVRKIDMEYNQNIDKHSQKLIVSNINLLLDYCTRYYDRQFYVRANLNQDLISNFDHLLKDYFNSEKPVELGLPTVQYCGMQLHMSPNYLGDLLKKETGKTAKDHIHSYVINRAKNKLLGTTESISEIAFDLGFDYPQHFSKLFKKKTGMSPAKYRTLN